MVYPFFPRKALKRLAAIRSSSVNNNWHCPQQPPHLYQCACNSSNRRFNNHGNPSLSLGTITKFLQFACDTPPVEELEFQETQARPLIKHGPDPTNTCSTTPVLWNDKSLSTVSGKIANRCPNDSPPAGEQSNQFPFSAFTAQPSISMRTPHQLYTTAKSFHLQQRR